MQFQRNERWFFTGISLRFTINANIVYFLVEATFSTSIMCPNYYGQYFNENGISLYVHWSQLSSFTERPSDNQRWTTLVRNDLPQVAIPNCNTFCGEQGAVKVINLIVVHWLNILCKCDGVSNGVIAINATLTSRSWLPALLSSGIYRSRKLTSEYSQYLNLVEFLVWGALQQKLYR